MLTVVVKRNAEPNIIQLTQENIMRELSAINNSEMLLEDTWFEGLTKVRTPYVCLVEADCTLSASYISSNFGISKKNIHWGTTGGGYVKLAMLSSCLGLDAFDNRIYNYELDKTKEYPLKYWGIVPYKKKRSAKPYPVQVGFVPGAIIRMSAIQDNLEELPWDDKNLVKMSTTVSFHFWNSNRRVQVNPNTTYVSTEDYLSNPPQWKLELPDRVGNLFNKEGIGI